MNSIKKQAGSMMMIALFIAILMLALGLALVQILSASAHNNTVEYIGARAFLAAQSGIEKSLTELFPIPGAAKTCSDITTGDQTFGQASYFSDCSFRLSCNDVEVNDAAVPSGKVTVFRLTSSATCKVMDCAVGEACRKDYWQAQRSINVEAKTLN